MVGSQVAPRLMAGLARAPELIDSARRRGSNIGFLVTDRFAFGDEVPSSYVEFVDEMLAGTSFDVLAEFFPNFDTLDKFAVLSAFAEVPTTILCGTKDLLTSVGHSRKMASRIPGARLVECDGAGHMVILERKDRVNAVLDELFAKADTAGAVADGDRSPGAWRRVRRAGRGRGRRRGARRHPRRLRRPRGARPAVHRDRRDRGVGGRLARRSTAACWRRPSSARSARCCSTRTTTGCSGCAGSRCTPTPSGSGSRARWSPPPSGSPHERGCDGLRLAARAELPRTVRFWEHLGYREVARDGVFLTLAKLLPVTLTAETAEDTQELGDPAGPAAAPRRPADPHRRPRGREDHASPRASAPRSASAARSPRRPS